MEPVRRLARAPRLWWASAGLVATGAIAYLLTHDPYRPGSYPACVLLGTTGFYCPACGGTRASYDLLHGDVGAAFARHPLVPPLFLVVVIWLAWRMVCGPRSTARHRALPAWVPVALGVAVLVFGVVRNVPGWAWLSPA
jgi:hypothetical protein